MAVQTTLNLSLRVNEILNSENKSGSVPTRIEEVLRLSDGTSAGQADLVFSDRRQLGNGANEDLDLAGSLQDSFGNTLTMVEVVGVFIRNRETAAASVLQVSAAAANGWAQMISGNTNHLKIKAGGFFLWWDDAGSAVTAGTGDLLNLANANGAATLDYDIVIVARSA
jgi:hypothetical protein